MSRTIARFSSSVVRSARSTWPVCDFATRHTTEAPGVDEGPDEGVLRRDPAGPTGGPEGGEGRVAQVELGPGALEELGVLRVGARATRPR